MKPPNRITLNPDEASDMMFQDENQWILTDELDFTRDRSTRFWYDRKIKGFTVKSIFVDLYVFRQKSTSRKVEANPGKAAV